MGARRAPAGAGLLAVLAVLPACAALDWLAEPVGGSSMPPGQAPAGVGPIAPGRPCACPSAPDLSLPEARAQARPDAPGAGQAGQGPDIRPSRGEALARGAARVGGLVTGNPLMWTIAGQLVAAGAAGLRRRRQIPTGQPAPG